MKKPLIGLTTYGRDEKNAFSLPAQYLESVRRAGAVPFLIAPDETELDSADAKVQRSGPLVQQTEPVPGDRNGCGRQQRNHHGRQQQQDRRSGDILRRGRFVDLGAIRQNEQRQHELQKKPATTNLEHGFQIAKHNGNRVRQQPFQHAVPSEKAGRRSGRRMQAHSGLKTMWQRPRA